MITFRVTHSLTIDLGNNTDHKCPALIYFRVFPLFYGFLIWCFFVDVIFNAKLGLTIFKLRLPLAAMQVENIRGTSKPRSEWFAAVCDRISLKLAMTTYAKLGQTMRELLWSSTRSLSSAARAKTVRLLAKLPDDTNRSVEDPQRIVTD